jgi:hypothetical protein
MRQGGKAMNLPRSTYYYRAAAEPEGPSDAELTSIIEDIKDELPCYGYRRVTHELRRTDLCSIAKGWHASCGLLVSRR